MIACEDLRSQAAGLAALPEDDPERAAAFLHARDCPECARALEEGVRLLAVLSAAPAPPPPRPEVLERVRAAVLAEFDRQSAHPRPSWTMALLPIAVLGTGVLLALREGAMQASTSELGVAAVLGAAALGTVFGVWSYGWRLLGLGLLASVLYSLVVAVRGSGEAGWDAQLGMHCALIELGAAVLPLGAGIYLVLRRQAAHVAATLGGAALAGALTGQAALHLACPNDGMAHLFVFHTTPVVLAALLGIAFSRVRGLRAG